MKHYPEFMFRYAVTTFLVILVYPVSGKLYEQDGKVLDKVKVQSAKVENGAPPANAPIQIKLNFQRRSGNFLLFYDYAGTPVYVRFMKHRWDYENEPFARNFDRGQSYYVTLSETRAIASSPETFSREGEEFARKTVEEIETRRIRNPSLAVMGKILRYFPSVLTELRY